MKKYTFLTAILFLCCSNIATAQISNCKGFLWVVPIDPSALPLGDPLTGNAKLNQIFTEYYVEEYLFLRSVYLEDIDSNEPIYEIRMKEGYLYLEDELCHLLQDSCNTLFKIVLKPYLLHQGVLSLHPIDPSVAPCSPTRSCNEQINTILDRYIIVSYQQNSWDNLIYVYCHYANLLNLYYDLLPLTYLLNEVTLMYNSCLYLDKGSISPSGILFHDPCAVSVSDNPKLDFVIVSPNPAYDHLTISGIFPQKITLYDWQGKEVLAKTDRSNKIDVSHLQRGLYFLYIISDTGTTYVQKIIKE